MRKTKIHRWVLSFCFLPQNCLKLKSMLEDVPGQLSVYTRYQFLCTEIRLLKILFHSSSILLLLSQESCVKTKAENEKIHLCELESVLSCLVLAFVFTIFLTSFLLGFHVR